VDRVSTTTVVLSAPLGVGDATLLSWLSRFIGREKGAVVLQFGPGGDFLQNPKSDELVTEPAGDIEFLR